MTELAKQEGPKCDTCGQPAWGKWEIEGRTEWYCGGCLQRRHDEGRQPQTRPFNQDNEDEDDKN